MSDESALRVGAFVVGFVLIAGWEGVAPHRRSTPDRGARWPGNLGVFALDAILVRLASPAGALAAAGLAEAHGWGILRLLDTPGWLAVAVTIITLDLVIYAQHRVFHAVPALWRIHRVHHADLAFDVTTGLRFHPLEILLSLLVKSLVVVALGAPAVAVLTFEVLLNATSMFNHANIRVASRWDQVLRLVVVTPDMHRVHHSSAPEETSRNFGFSLPWWDRLLGTYRAQPRAGHERLTIGLPGVRDPRRCQSLRGMLAFPFVRRD